MERLIRHFVRFPIYANLLMGSILIFGLATFVMMKYSFFPEAKSDVVIVEVIYPGAAPEEVEEGVVLKLEQNLEGVEGIDRITAVSSENGGVLTIFGLDGTDMEKLLADIKNAVDRTVPWPRDAEEPNVYLREPRSRTISFAVHGNADLWVLKQRAENFRDKLVSLDGISQIKLEGFPGRQISIEVREADLLRFGLTFQDILNGVRKANVDISGGKIDTQDEEILIRAFNRGYYPDHFNNIPIRADGKQIVRLNAVADVIEKWEDRPDRAFYNGNPAVIVTVQKTLDEDLMDIAKKVRDQIEIFRQLYPEIQLSVTEDATVMVTQRINLLRNNGVLGFLLVCIALTLFLNLRLSFWVALGIPISFSGMMIIAFWSGITINMISMFGMIIVIGILVDDAIIVGENIFQHRERGLSPIEAAVKGTSEVFLPVMMAVATTILAFLPFFYIEGNIGKFIWHISLVVTASLAFSMIESILILPAHLAHSKGLKNLNSPSPMRKRLEAANKYLAQKLYAPGLRFSINNKYLSVSLIISIFLIVVVGLLGSGIVPSTFFPHIERDNFGD